QPVIGPVGAVNYFIHTLERKYADHRSEDFVFGNGHLILHVVKDRGLDEVAVAAMALAAEHELGAFLLANVAVLQNLVHLLIGDLRSLLGGGIERIAELALLGFRCQPFDKFFLDFFFDKESRTGGAALAAMEINGVKGAIHGLFHISIGEDHVGA